MATSSRKLVLLFSSLYISLTNAQNSPSAAVLPIINLGYAIYQGVPFKDVITGATNTQFLGIRYAAPPTGALRFAAPQRPGLVPGLQLANTPPKVCYPSSSGKAPRTPFRTIPTIVGRESEKSINVTKRQSDPTISEDCLFLSVYVPGQLKEKKNLPVVVWIHGGGYIAGNALTNNGTDIIREAGGGVVVVTFHYRLGVFGFLPGQKVKNGGALNAGLLDQQFALKWVQQHISKFGGNPKEVTIWGESAGAGSVLQHVVANGGRTRPPLFRAAITSSAFLPSQYKYDDRIPEMLYKDTASQTGCASAKDTLKCLRSIDVATLQAANMAINRIGFYGTFVFVPVVDGTFITDRPTQLLKQRRVNGEVLYSVTNSFEGTLFVNQTMSDTETSSYITNLFPELSIKDVVAGTAIYSSLGCSNITLAGTIMGESILICPTYWMLRAFGAKSFKSEFALPPALHADDLAYYFNNGAPPKYQDANFNKAFTHSFMNIAMSLNPNKKWESDITAFFPPWIGGHEMLFNKTESGAPVVKVVNTSKDLLRRCDYWESVSASSAQ